MRPRHVVCPGKLSWGNRACALLLFCATIAIASSAQTLTTLHSFDSTDGANPFPGLVQATDGNFYGTTYGGGANANNGTVFKITPSGTLTTLYSFCAQSGCTDGALPAAGLVQAGDGNLYGTAVYGGANNRGTIFKITPSGTLTTLYSFCAQNGCADGALPFAGLVQANGNFYGTTEFGGTYSYGAIFRITPSGTLTTLYSFCANSGCPDGARPAAGLIQATNGVFYGTTQAGGANKNAICAVEGCGTVFKVTPVGALTTLYSFCSKSGCTDGQTSDAGLIQATDGNFYGTTVGGGANNNNGTIFKISPSGTLTTLYSLCSQSACTDGQSPVAGLIQATAGNFYGTTVSGGTLGAGTIFKITPSGTLTTLHSFCTQSGCVDGQEPNAGLIQGTNGSFYGTTFIGGAHGYGAVFNLSTGLGPFVETRPTSGKVGAAVKILGTNLTGATSVAFNGTAATFTVVSSTEITTTVPTGATTGNVQVTTPRGTLKSNVVFRVIP
jgi:uncharacterized repeat protein (TIGR03803 family)